MPAPALLNAQPMGFYAPPQIVCDAREHGVPVRPVCINPSEWDCTLEASGSQCLALRLGLRLVRGLSAQDASRLLASRGQRGRFDSIEILERRIAFPRDALKQLAASDAFQISAWRVRGLDTALPPLFAIQQNEPAVRLSALSEGGEIPADYRSTGLTLRHHLLALLRSDLPGRGITSCIQLGEVKDGRRLCIAGIVLVRQKPGSAKG